VLTRLHARYAKGTLGEDLVFRAAPPIVGGREMMAFGAALEHTPTPSSFNNFQARYAIRHPWSGAIACEHPVRGVWGGPPQGHADERAVSATNLAFATRGGASKLASFIGYHERPTPTPSASSAPAQTSTTPAPNKGCGCEIAPSPVSRTFAVLGCLAFGIGIIRRRRR
jgi:hypothetical protein